MSTPEEGANTPEDVARELRDGIRELQDRLRKAGQLSKEGVALFIEAFELMAEQTAKLAPKTREERLAELRRKWPIMHEEGDLLASRYAIIVWAPFSNSFNAIFPGPYLSDVEAALDKLNEQAEMMVEWIPFQIINLDTGKHVLGQPVTWSAREVDYEVNDGFDGDVSTVFSDAALKLAKKHKEDMAL